MFPYLVVLSGYVLISKISYFISQFPSTFLLLSYLIMADFDVQLSRRYIMIIGTRAAVFFVLRLIFYVYSVWKFGNLGFESGLQPEIQQNGHQWLYSFCLAEDDHPKQVYPFYGCCNSFNIVLHLKFVMVISE